jgi:hypothetical protein
MAFDLIIFLGFALPINLMLWLGYKKLKNQAYKSYVSYLHRSRSAPSVPLSTDDYLLDHSPRPPGTGGLFGRMKSESQGSLMKPHPDESK